MSAAVAAGQAIYNATASAVRGLVGVMKSSIEAATESEFADKKMTEMLKNSGKVTNDQIESLRKYAETMQFKIGIDDENIKQGIAMLGTFKLQGDTIQKTIPILGALANAYKTSTGEAVNLQDWAIKIGKAEALPELATMLRRIGIVFDENQIKALKVANEEQRVKIITQELTAEFGKGTWATEGYGGKIQVLGLMLDEVKEKFGGALIQGLLPFVTKLVEWVQTDQAQKKIQDIATKIGELTTDMVNWTINVAVPWVQQHWPAIKASIQGVIEKTADIINWIRTHRTETGLLVGVLGALIAALGFAMFAINPVLGVVMMISGAFMVWRSAINFVRNEFEIFMGAIDRLKIKLSQMPVLGAIMQIGHSLHIPGFASGTNYAPGGLAVVGERGPELVNLPQGSQVIPNNKIGQSISVNIYGNISTANGQQDIVDLSKMLGNMIQRAGYNV